MTGRTTKGYADKVLSWHCEPEPEPSASTSARFQYTSDYSASDFGEYDLANDTIDPDDSISQIGIPPPRRKRPIKVENPKQDRPANTTNNKQATPSFKAPALPARTAKPGNFSELKQHLLEISSPPSRKKSSPVKRNVTPNSKSQRTIPQQNTKGTSARNVTPSKPVSPKRPTSPRNTTRRSTDRSVSSSKPISPKRPTISQNRRVPPSPKRPTPDNKKPTNQKKLTVYSLSTRSSEASASEEEEEEVITKTPRKRRKVIIDDSSDDDDSGCVRLGDDQEDGDDSPGMDRTESTYEEDPLRSNMEDENIESTVLICDRGQASKQNNNVEDVYSSTAELILSTMFPKIDQVICEKMDFGSSSEIVQHLCGEFKRYEEKHGKSIRI